VGEWTSDASYGWFSLNVDAAGDNLSFSAQDNAGSQTNYLSVPISWTASGWHFIALTYSTNSTALYVDGQLATNGVGMSVWPSTNVLSNGFDIGSDTNGNSQARGIFDDICTFSIPLNSSAVSNLFLNEETVIQSSLTLHALLTQQTPGSVAEIITPEIQALADGLQDDPLKIYNYVHDHIKYGWYNCPQTSA